MRRGFFLLAIFGGADAYDFGSPSHRVKRWTIFRHEVNDLNKISPLSTFLRQLHRVCNITWRGFLCAKEDELREELTWAMQRAAVCKRRRQLVSEDSEDLTLASDNPFWRALNEFEQNNVAEYAKRWPRRACSLFQSADKYFASKS